MTRTTPAADPIRQVWPEVLGALEEALDIIQVFHGTRGWYEYQASPEMQRLRAALTKAREIEPHE